MSSRVIARGWGRYQLCRGGRLCDKQKCIIFRLPDYFIFFQYIPFIVMQVATYGLFFIQAKVISHEVPEYTHTSIGSFVVNLYNNYFE